ncbi:3-oxoacyl-ACP reductase [Hypericibacter terrae]|uniref:3-oxoacyl-ACP reductase n=1 Tax=Hypericibacter terrae TaxID=2602015 RepID=A0A5J6MPV5_9PROT|nr:SDR family NAD(P)-dependent oxidoreductase [Hypericibacter terrae]QEX19413.1 3-oxoacyl-ACP reductase [Hypericibacter terrae]
MSYFPNRPYNVAVIGAASGIGEAAARFLAAEGARVACLDANEAGAATVAKALPAKGGESFSARTDVTDAASVENAIAGTAKAFGQIHALVNCAGITGKTNIKAHEVELADFDRVHAINLRGALIVSQAILRHMLPHNYGRLLHVASIAGKEGNAGMTAYSATKAGLIGMVKSMGKDYAETGVTVNALAPAVIRTPLVAALPDATVKYMTDKIPMRRCGELEECAAMIAFILSPACSFTTGFTFDLTGGRATY